MFDFLDTLLSGQNLLIASGIIIIGCVLLVFGADRLVDGASGLAKKMGISNLTIGLTVVAFGTSMPEFVVNMVAAINNNTEIAITNVLGSNNINIFVILGLTALILPITSKKESRDFDIPWSILAGILTLLLATYTSPWGNVPQKLGVFTLQEGYITRVGGILLLICFIIFIWHSLKVSKKTNDHTQKEDYTPISPMKAILLIILGLSCLVLGGEFIVKSATSIAHHLGVSDAIIGLTIVALGTSLPELATSCIAAAKGNCDIALGNILGSNIFNVFFILGMSAIVTPLPTYSGLWLDALMVTLGSVLIMIFVYFTKKHEIKRWHGGVFVTLYICYLTYRLLTL